MDHFTYIKGDMFAENVALRTIAEEVGTPVYVYSTATLKRHYNVFKQSLGDLDALVCFAMKANSNQAVLKTLAAEGAGADVVSGGELARALKAGIPASKIVFSGVAKTKAEMRAALDAGILQFNIESEPELLALSSVASAMGKVAPVSMRINPDVDAQTHAKISTGLAENKFGVAWQKAQAVYTMIKDFPGVEAVGIDMHIGSQLTALTPYDKAFARIVKLVTDLRAAGHNIKHLDLGGGLGIPYDPEASIPPGPDAYGLLVKEHTKDLDCKLIFEPGRMIAGNAGVLLSKVEYIKDGDDRRFVILDAGMNDLSRPAMYDAFHHIDPVTQAASDAEMQAVDFVGPVCESGDTFAKARMTTPLKAGDLVVIRSSGAYGAVMANTYNSRLLVPEVMVNDKQMAVIRKRETIEDLIAKDTLPEWL